MRAGLCIGVLEPHISASVFPLLAAAAVSCLYHTVPQAPKLSILWQPRYSSSRTASLCGSRLSMCVDITYACVLCVILVRVYVCAGLWIYLCADTPHFSFLFYCVCLLQLPYHVCITPCLMLSSSLLCGNHVTTAVVQQVCVDHFCYACLHCICVCYDT